MKGLKALAFYYLPSNFPEATTSAYCFLKSLSPSTCPVESNFLRNILRFPQIHMFLPFCRKSQIFSYSYKHVKLKVKTSSFALKGLPILAFLLLSLANNYSSPHAVLVTICFLRIFIKTNFPQ